MKPTLSNLFCNPESSAREVDVLPTCCFVAATKIGRCFLRLALEENQEMVVAEAVEHLAIPRARVEQLGDINIFRLIAVGYLKGRSRSTCEVRLDNKISKIGAINNPLSV